MTTPVIITIVVFLLLVLFGCGFTAGYLTHMLRTMGYIAPPKREKGETK